MGTEPRRFNSYVTHIGMCLLMIFTIYEYTELHVFVKRFTALKLLVVAIYRHCFLYDSGSNGFYSDGITCHSHRTLPLTQSPTTDIGPSSPYPFYHLLCQMTVM